MSHLTKNTDPSATARENHLVALWEIIAKECEIFIKNNKNSIGLAEVGPMTSRIYAKLADTVPMGQVPGYYRTAARNCINTDVKANYGWTSRKERIKREDEEEAFAKAKVDAIAQGKKPPLPKMEKEFRMPKQDNGSALFSFLVPALKGANGYILAEEEIDRSGRSVLESRSGLFGNSEIEAEEAIRITWEIIRELPEKIMMATVEICDSADGRKKKPCRCQAAMRWTDKKKTAALAELDKWGEWVGKELAARLGVSLPELGFGRTRL